VSILPILENATRYRDDNHFYSGAFFSDSCALFCLLLHFLALTKNSTLFLSSDSALFAQKKWVWAGQACPRPCAIIAFAASPSAKKASQE
jgi:hypothetical protein